MELTPLDASASIFYVAFSSPAARLQLALGNRAEAEAYLAEQYVLAGQAGWRYAQIEIRILQALAAPSSDKALVFLTDALTMAQPEGFKRIFLDKGQQIGPLLHLAAGKQVHAGYIRELLTLLERAAPNPSKPSPPLQDSSSLVEAISEREIEVLQLLARGLTYQEIAQDLFVSVNTVKSHLKSIYSKLDVHNRREAVAQARVLHLIDSQ